MHDHNHSERSRGDIVRAALGAGAVVSFNENNGSITVHHPGTDTRGVVPITIEQIAELDADDKKKKANYDASRAVHEKQQQFNAAKAKAVEAAAIFGVDSASWPAAYVEAKAEAARLYLELNPPKAAKASK